MATFVRWSRLKTLREATQPRRNRGGEPLKPLSRLRLPFPPTLEQLFPTKRAPGAACCFPARRRRRGGRRSRGKRIVSAAMATPRSNIPKCPRRRKTGGKRRRARPLESSRGVRRPVAVAHVTPPRATTASQLPRRAATVARAPGGGSTRDRRCLQVLKGSKEQGQHLTPATPVAWRERSRAHSHLASHICTERHGGVRSGTPPSVSDTYRS